MVSVSDDLYVDLYVGVEMDLWDFPQSQNQIISTTITTTSRFPITTLLWGLGVCWYLGWDLGTDFFPCPIFTMTLRQDTVITP